MILTSFIIWLKNKYSRFIFKNENIIKVLQFFFKKAFFIIINKIVIYKKKHLLKTITYDNSNNNKTILFLSWKIKTKTFSELNIEIISAVIWNTIFGYAPLHIFENSNLGILCHSRIKLKLVLWETLYYSNIKSKTWNVYPYILEKKYQYTWVVYFYLEI